MIDSQQFLDALFASWTSELNYYMTIYDCATFDELENELWRSAGIFTCNPVVL